MNDAGAFVGVVGGVFAIVWTLWRAYRERESLQITYYTYLDGNKTPPGSVGLITIVNTGTLPAYIVSVQTTEKLPWPRKWPIGRLSKKTRQRWPLRPLFEGVLATYRNIRGFEPRPLAARDFMQLKLDDWHDTKRWEDERRWASVETAIKTYSARLRTPLRPK
jgi:hypothetical protein